MVLAPLLAVLVLVLAPLQARLVPAGLLVLVLDLVVPASVLQSGESLPAETRTFAHSVARADSVVLYFVPEPKRYAVRMQVQCRTREDAVELAAQLTKLTTLVRQAFTTERQAPNPADLTGVLAAGSFVEVNSRVLGYWPIERKFLENLLGG